MQILDLQFEVMNVNHGYSSHGKKWKESEKPLASRHKYDRLNQSWREAGEGKWRYRTVSVRYHVCCIPLSGGDVRHLAGDECIPFLR